VPHAGGRTNTSYKNYIIKTIKWTDVKEGFTYQKARPARMLSSEKVGADPALGFTIVAGEKTVDMQCTSVSQRDSWITALRAARAYVQAVTPTEMVSSFRSGASPR
jgi:hypothetical protein